LTEGTYVVLITDGIDTSYVVANLKAPPVLYTINATTESTCDAENGTAAVTAFGGSPPYKYSWDDPNSQSNALATGLAVGSYSVTVSDIDSCFITELLVVLNKPGITVNTIITKPSCIVDSNGTIDITVTGGAPPYNYLWSPDVSTDSIGIDIGIGDYVITITDVDSCEVVNNVTVTAAGGADCDVKADVEWKIFSGITPDGDGIDDVWEIRGLKQFDAVTVQIFTNRGVVVWSSDNYENDFEGKDNNDNLLMPGVYYYVVTRTEAVDKGWLHIKR
ncbi:MAG: gliding motility-associated C-terminal domain-containing protein, partial [Flavobacteriales bacterium]|nr:gliding motility-associated C-terminal domain-containing protein [Flavobacteriales bacterium]